MSRALSARLAGWAARLRQDVAALWIAGRDRRTGRGVRLFALAVAAYALSPVDLIPDVIPVLGLLDDLVIVPAGIWLIARMIPPPLMREFRDASRQFGKLPVSKGAAAVIVGLWLALLSLGGWWLFGTPAV